MRSLQVAVLVFVVGCAALADENSPIQPDPPKPDKRAFGVIPNYKTVELGTQVEAITRTQKFDIAVKDTFDIPILGLTGMLAGFAQLQDSNPSFGQGAKGYGKRYAAGYADQVMNTMLVEGVFPAAFHHDPRYFRKGTGGPASRIFYSTSRLWLGRDDSGHNRFNYSEFLGNAAAAGVSNLYYADGRTASDNLSHLGVLLATDLVANVLKEFWPDAKRKFLRKH